jgi:hypothetical protein
MFLLPLLSLVCKRRRLASNKNMRLPTRVTRVGMFAPLAVAQHVA